MSVRRRRIGLLGGSFNPAHLGHVHVSKQALQRLSLDEVWWLVSPQNPLKSTEEMSEFEQRVASARALTAIEPAMKVSCFEMEQGTQYTVDTLEQLQRHYPRFQFVWLMGADNLAQFHRWRGWKKILNMVPIAVFDRAPYSYGALKSQAAQHYADFRVKEPEVLGLMMRSVPAWCYVQSVRHAQSSTALRKNLENKEG